MQLLSQGCKHDVFDAIQAPVAAEQGAAPLHTTVSVSVSFSLKPEVYAASTKDI